MEEASGSITREQLLLYVKKQKESIKKLTEDLAKQREENTGNGYTLSSQTRPIFHALFLNQH